MHWESFPLLFCSTQQLTNLLNSFESLFSWERGALLALPFSFFPLSFHVFPLSFLFLTFFSALSFLFLSSSVPPFFFTKPWMAIGHRPKSDTHVFREFSKEKEFLQRPIFLSSNTNRIQQLRVRVCEGIVKPASFPAADYDVQ